LNERDNYHSSGLEISLNLWNSSIHYGVRKNPPLVPLPSEPNVMEDRSDDMKIVC